MNDTPLPADIAAEQATIGAILLNRDAIIPIASWLRPEHMYSEKHHQIYAACLACYARGEPPDTRTIGAELARRNQLDSIGGYPYLGELPDSVPTSYHVEHYARIVHRCAVNRNLISVGGRIAAIGYQEQETDAALAAAQAELDALASGPQADTGLVPLSTIIDARFELYQAAAEKGEAVQLGLSVGLRDLDELTGGFRGGDLIILAARPSVGKSALAGSMAYAVGMADRRVDLFSLEMSHDQVTDRLVAIDSGIDLSRIRTWGLREAELTVYLESLGRCHRLPIAIDDSAALGVADIRSRILRRGATIGPPDLVIVDYLQLMSSPRRDGNRVREVGDISRGLKALAKELTCPVLALSQLSRAVEGRTSHVPLLSDLRESGDLEQDADIVMFIYREELYDRETDKKGIAEIHVAKHRNGAQGVVPLRFDAPTTSFHDLTYRTDPNPSTTRTKDSVWPNYD